MAQDAVLVKQARHAQHLWGIRDDEGRREDQQRDNALQLDEAPAVGGLHHLVP